MTEERPGNTAHDKGTSIKAFVNDEGETTLVCPQCSAAKTVVVDRFRDRQHKLRVRCSCTNVFQVNLDFRKSYRKPTALEGIYDMVPPASGGGKVKIVNLSIDGICFEVSGNHRLVVGQRGAIDFTLDDRKKTRLRREFIVKMIRGNAIGCAFKKEQAFEKELGFYLRFGP